MSISGKFYDWTGAIIAYRIRATREEEPNARSGDVLTCEVDPRGVDQWKVMARGRTTAGALRAGIDVWNASGRIASD